MCFCALIESDILEPKESVIILSLSFAIRSARRNRVSPPPEGNLMQPWCQPAATQGKIEIYKSSGFALCVTTDV